MWSKLTRLISFRRPRRSQPKQAIAANCSLASEGARTPRTLSIAVTSPSSSLFYLAWRPIIGAPRAFDDSRDEMVSNPTKNMFEPLAFLAKVGTGKTISVYQKDQIVFSQGDVADTICYIQMGGIKIVVLSDQGKEAVVGILEPGQFFGEGCMNGHSLRISTSTATEESLITA
jgi:CRP-like cAMP-binding protein